MTVVALQRFTKLPSVNAVRAVLLGSSSPATEPIGFSADLGALASELTSGTLAGSTITASADGFTAQLLHGALISLPRRSLLDPSFWTWLALNPMREYTARRWGGDPSEMANPKDSLVNHFRCSGSLNGFSRNSCARLFWAANASFEFSGDYSAVPALFESADLFTGIFERKLGLSPLAAVVLSQTLISKPENVRREVLRKLNHALTTTTLEFISEAQLVELVDSLLP